MCEGERQLSYNFCVNAGKQTKEQCFTRSLDDVKDCLHTCCSGCDEWYEGECLCPPKH